MITAPILSEPMTLQEIYDLFRIAQTRADRCFVEADRCVAERATATNRPAVTTDTTGNASVCNVRLQATLACIIHGGVERSVIALKIATHFHRLGWRVSVMNDSRAEPAPAKGWGGNPLWSRLPYLDSRIHGTDSR